MNKTEQKAYRWLLQHGYSEKDIVYQRRRSPDFLTSDKKGFEVKKLYGKNVIKFGPTQFSGLKSLKNVTVLVFAEDTDELITQFPSNKLEKNGVINGIKIFATDYGLIHLEIKKETHKRLLSRKVEWELDSIDEVITRLLDYEEGKP